MSPHRPRPDTVENMWLNKSLEDRLTILRTVSPAKLDAISVMVDHCLKDEWKTIGHKPTGTGEPTYQWQCDKPGVTKKGGA